MSRPNIIERAYQLAEAGKSIEKIRSQLKREMYESVDAHLCGASLRQDLRERAARPVEGPDS